MSAPAAGNEIQLIYNWVSRFDNRRHLAVWIFAAILLHAGAWFLFRITYPPAVRSEPSHAGFYIILPGTDLARDLAARLAAGDPALFAADRTRGPGFADPPIPAYQPSYATAAPALRPLPDPAPSIEPPLLTGFGAVPLSEGRAPAASPAPTPAQATQLVFGGALRSRAIVAKPETIFRARPGDQLAAADYLVAVSPEGTVLHVFEQPHADSRNPEINAAAVQFLMATKFAPAPGPGIQWDVGAFHWGTDVQREAVP